MTPVLLFTLKEFQNKQQDCSGDRHSSEAGPGPPDVPAVPCGEAGPGPQDVPAVPCGGGCLLFDEEGLEDVGFQCDDACLSSFWFKLPSSSQLVPKPSTPRSRASSSRRRWRSCCSQTSFVRGVYQWIHEDS